MDLSITNVINISVADQGKGVGEYNTSNLALFTREAQSELPESGFELFLRASEVIEKFGTSAVTSKIASAVFSQVKNILTGGGYLAVIPFLSASQILTFGAIATAGGYDLIYNAGAPVSFLYTDIDDVASFQAKVRTIVGLEKARVEIAEDKLSATIFFDGFSAVPALISVSNNTLTDVAVDPVTLVPTQGQGIETLQEAILRTQELVQYFGIMSSELVKNAELLSTATYVQTLKKIYFPVSNLKADFAIDGIFDLVRQAGLDQTRCLYYGGTSEESLTMCGAYAGRALSTNFNGSRTTQTMHLKDLAGVLPDSTVSQANLNTCKTSGVDLYVSIQGVPKVYTSGGNKFFDRVYNRLWLVGRLEVDGFNVLARTQTKIPQTEDGVAVLVSAYREVIEQAIVNEYVARGKWNSPDTFGNLQDFRSNIEERGYYIYTQPIALQSASEREARKAPLAQIAIKEAGAIHSADIIVNINA